MYCRPHLTRSRLAPVILMHSSPTFTVYLYSSIAAPCDWLRLVNTGLLLVNGGVNSCHLLVTWSLYWLLIGCYLAVRGYESVAPGVHGVEVGGEGGDLLGAGHHLVPGDRGLVPPDGLLYQQLGLWSVRNKII